MTNGNGPEWTIDGSEDWKDRFACCLEPNQAQPIVFVVGAGMSPTVWGVQKILDYVKQEYQIEAPGGAASEAYGSVMRKLGVKKRPATANCVIRRAVLSSTTLDEHEKEYGEVLEHDPVIYKRACVSIEEQRALWKIPDGTRALARAIQCITEQPHHQPLRVITTNFDPLIEVALNDLGVVHDSRSLAGNQYPNECVKRVRIWHIHGCWWDSTLHDAMSLAGKREGLKAAIRDCLNGAEVFVLGYGGWNDVLFDTAVEMLEQGLFENPPSVAWAFYDKEPKRNCQHVLGRFSGGRSSSQVAFFAGIDLHKLLPEIVGLTQDATKKATGPKDDVAKPQQRSILELLTDVRRASAADHLEMLETFRQQAERNEHIDLIQLVGFLCEALDARHGPARTAFAIAAKQLVKRLALELVAETSTDVAEVKGCNGKIARVSVRTHLVVEILLARAGGRLPEWRSHVRGAVGTGAMPVEDNFAFESGNSPEASLQQFEGMIWPLIVANNGRAYDAGRDRDVLHSRLRADAVLGKTHSVILGAGSGGDWNDIAGRVRTVAFIEMGGPGNNGIELDEHVLAHLISDFMAKCESKDSP